jgi:YidC/Oxa1 family membrane protein insertase
MPDILWPIKWAIEAILVFWHGFFSAVGMPADAGMTWILSIIGLVVVVRSAMIPVFVRQIKSQRNMLVMQPELAAMQKKYKGKTDPESRQRFAAEQMELYKKYKANPLSSCLPLLLQMPIFGGLFVVLNEAQKSNPGVGLLSQDLAGSFAHASFLGAELSANFNGNTSAKIMAAVMIILMTASQFITQRQIMSKNQNPAAMNSQYAQTQKIMLYVFPLIFAVSSFAFPLGVMWYWLASNFWTMGQQFIVIRNMPTPGSEAHAAREARLAKKGKALTVEQIEQLPEATKQQRVQPVSKTRAKKKP